MGSRNLLYNLQRIAFIGVLQASLVFLIFLMPREACNFIKFLQIQQALHDTEKHFTESLDHLNQQIAFIPPKYYRLFFLIY